MNVKLNLLDYLIVHLARSFSAYALTGLDFDQGLEAGPVAFAQRLELGSGWGEQKVAAAEVTQAASVRWSVVEGAQN